MARLIAPPLTWGVASAARQGEERSGDAHLVQLDMDGALVAVVDAVGHGNGASATAEMVVRTLRAGPPATLPERMLRLHQVLRATLGAAVSLAAFDWQTARVQWLGVGNVAGMLVSGAPATRPVPLLVRGGIVGADLPALEPETIALLPGSTLVIATDGVRLRLDQPLMDRRNPGALAARLLQCHGSGDDDALVLVLHYPGRTP